ncbi:MAG: ribosome hibernation-promoting factor, HPF/YfiA family [Acholeplasmataceae bacterium]
MTFDIIGKNGFVATPSIQAYVEKKLSKVDKFMNEDIQLIRVVMKVYPNFHKAEVTLTASHVMLRAEVKDKDMYAAIDLVSDKLIEQIKKYKTKLERKKMKSNHTFNEDQKPVDVLEKEMLAAQLVKNKKIELKPMNVEDAIEHMERLDHDFFVYLDDKTHQTHVLYRREDGDYAVIETTE